MVQYFYDNIDRSKCQKCNKNIANRRVFLRPKTLLVCNQCLNKLRGEYNLKPREKCRDKYYIPPVLRDSTIISTINARILENKEKTILSKQTSDKLKKWWDNLSDDEKAKNLGKLLKTLKENRLRFP